MGLLEFLVLSFKFKSNFNICSWIKLILAIQCIIEVLVYQGKPSIDFNILFCLIWIALRIVGGLSIKNRTCIQDGSETQLVYINFDF